MEYKEYQHVVKLDDPEVEGLLVGKCYIFPKIDGSNGTVWSVGNGLLSTGSRRRDLSKEGSNDNQGFREYIINDPRYRSFFLQFPDKRLYGEWLVPHTLKTYRDDAWRKFYVFDVVNVYPDGDEQYVPYEIYKEWLDKYEIEYIVPLRTITDPMHDQLLRCVEQNTFLIKENEGVGEGVVIKNYNFVNKFGRVTWAKIVRNEFKDALHKEQGSPEMINHLIEKELVDKFCTKDIVDKVYTNIIIEHHGTWSDDETVQAVLAGEQIFEKKWIPRLLETVFYEFVREEIWSMVKSIKANRIRSIDFNNLKQHTFNKVREFYPQLFRRNNE